MASCISLPRETTLVVMMVISAIFFVVEIVSSYIAGSIALVADAFHMLSDVMSLVIALYAIKMAARTTRGPKFSYGWQRAEILGALINGVFLLALCFTIIIDALQRFVTPVHIENPMLVLIVGSIGLAMNLVGLLLFHEHAHGHAHAHRHSHDHDHSHSFKIGRHGKHKVDDKHLEPCDDNDNVTRLSFQDGPLANLSLYPPHQQKADIINAAEILSHRDLAEASHDSVIDVASKAANRYRPPQPAGHLSSPSSSHNTISPENSDLMHRHNEQHPSTESHHDHDHAYDHGGHHHGHSHDRKSKNGHLNMQGVFLHVLGDALASIGVVISALVIQFGKGEWKYYADPFISLVITALITASTVPLVRSAAYILLQGVPQSVPIDLVRERILELDGIIDVHELHVWQLSDTKAIASVHVIVQAPFTTAYGSIPPDYMNIAYEIKQLLHEYGIHSTTVQPEFLYSKGKVTAEAGGRSNTGSAEHSNGVDVVVRKSPSFSNHCNSHGGNTVVIVDADAPDKSMVETTCLLRCEDLCVDTCCPPNTTATRRVSPTITSQGSPTVPSTVITP
ncbi:hypothetical protein SeMB42_g03761 [Synchytrium endobioticum]|uniref:Cation efflux protein n=1 Tax=Synchytrium endobioticum TaxID=286115 RepID=A0A507D4X6_9FUNG|nr:hypothetical protein SeLEV6574_g05333 [Synchytrium endobioticum]TPX46300.1 hypothetical protein SeMB42_g03761 [Synchytrium endobioticum]